MLKRLLFLVSFLTLVVGAPAYGATITETGLEATTIDKCSLRIEGEIQKGDASKVAAVFDRQGQRMTDYAYKTTYKGLDYVACLSGSGGDYAEAVKIAELFIQRAVATSVPSQETCAEACAIAFMGGRDCCVEMGLTMTKRHLSRNARLGLAAPSIRVSEGTLTAAETSAAFEQSIAVISELQDKARELGIGPDIINNIISHRNGDIFFIEPDPAHKHNYVDANGGVFQDIWVPGISGVVNQ